MTRHTGILIHVKSTLRLSKNWSLSQLEFDIVVYYGGITQKCI